MLTPRMHLFLSTLIAAAGCTDEPVLIASQDTRFSEPPDTIGSTDVSLGSTDESIVDSDTEGEEHTPSATSLPVESEWCGNGVCVEVVGDPEYCSFEGHRLTEGKLFSTKSKVTILSGTFPLNNDSLPNEDNWDVEIDAPPLELVVESADGRAVLSPTADTEGYLSLETVNVGEGGEPVYANTERLLLRRNFVSDGGKLLDRVFVGMARLPGSQIRFDASASAKDFYDLQGYINVMSPLDSVFPGDDDVDVVYGPCEFDHRPTSDFVFTTLDGDELAVTTTQVWGGFGISGYYYGRVVSAKGVWAGEDVEISDANDLAYFGAQVEAPMPPTIVVRFSEEDPDGSCGVIFQYEGGLGLDTAEYRAYQMTCAEEIGEEIEIQGVKLPAGVPWNL